MPPCGGLFVLWLQGNRNAMSEHKLNLLHVSVGGCESITFIPRIVRSICKEIQDQASVSANLAGFDTTMVLGVPKAVYMTYRIWLGK